MLKFLKDSKHDGPMLHHHVISKNLNLPEISSMHVTFDNDDSSSLNEIVYEIQYSWARRQAKIRVVSHSVQGQKSALHLFLHIIDKWPGS